MRAIDAMFTYLLQKGFSRQNTTVVQMLNSGQLCVIISKTQESLLTEGIRNFIKSENFELAIV